MLIIFVVSAGAFVEERGPAILFGVSLLCKVNFWTFIHTSLRSQGDCYHSKEISLMISVFTGHH